MLASTVLPRREAEILLEAVTGFSRAQLFTHLDVEVGAANAAQFIDFSARRVAGEPLAYILGEREFWSLSIAVTPDVLIPRVDTECLVAWAVELLTDLAEPACLDLGTGSGAIALAIKSEVPHGEVMGVDSSDAALAVAAANGERLGLPISWHHGSWFQPVRDQRFDLIVSNPPYIAEDDPHLREGDLPFEPQGALRAGPDGLSCLRTLINEAQGQLRPGGWFLVEHGWDQGSAVRDLMMRSEWISVKTRRDLAGHERVTGAQRPYG